MIKLFLIFFVSLFALNAWSQVDTNVLDLHLRKLSIVLRGQVPTLNEYSKYRQLLTSNAMSLDQITALASSDFINTRGFVNKFSNHVANQFRIHQTNVGGPVKFDFENPGLLPTSLQENVFSLLTKEILYRDLPWIELVNHKEYHLVYSALAPEFMADNYTFYAGVMDSVQNQPALTPDELVNTIIDQLAPIKYLKLSFPPTEQRVAGVLTTPEFIKRYVTTGVNKNRKRAAAVFRNFLCKDMIAAIPVAVDGIDENKKLALLGIEEYTEQDIINHTKMAEIHGTKAECMKCHRQLDPMGDFFGFTANKLSPFQSSGGLVYRAEDGIEVKVENVPGVGSLGEILLQQNDYYSCQVRQFWKWVYGENKMLSPKKEIELVAVFKNLHLKPKQFVNYLVSQPEFFETKTYTEAQILTFSAYKTLKKCQSCHNIQEDNENMRGLNWFDLIDNRNHPKREGLLNRSLKQLTKEMMPPEESRKDFTEKEMTDLTLWLQKYRTNFEGL